jgi:hypothetical protein
LVDEARERRVGSLIDRLLTEAVHLGYSAEEVAAMVAERMRQFQFVGTGS